MLIVRAELAPRLCRQQRHLQFAAVFVVQATSFVAKGNWTADPNTLLQVIEKDLIVELLLTFRLDLVIITVSKGLMLGTWKLRARDLFCNVQHLLKAF